MDDDSYVHVDSLLAAVAVAPRRRLFMGHIDREAGGPHRDKSSQWYITKEEWPSEVFPYWAHGAGYVLSRVILGQIRNLQSSLQMQVSKHDFHGAFRA